MRDARLIAVGTDCGLMASPGRSQTTTTPVVVVGTKKLLSGKKIVFGYWTWLWLRLAVARCVL